MTTETTPGTVGIYCDDHSPFHGKHGRSWHDTFTRDDLGNWTYVPVQRSRETAPRATEPYMGNAGRPQHTAHIRGEPRPVGDMLYDLNPFRTEEVRERAPEGNPLRTMRITYNWQCRCGNALSVQDDRLGGLLGKLIDSGVKEVSLDGLRYMLRP